MEQIVVKTPSESTIRRRAHKEGFRVRKSRTINLSLADLGEYMLIDAACGRPVIGDCYDATLAEIGEFLAGPTTQSV